MVLSYYGPHRCRDCSADTEAIDEWYMVRPSIWRRVGMPAKDTIDGFLCIGCLEKRLGRQLTTADFTDCRLNEPGSYHSARLNSRLLNIAEDQLPPRLRRRPPRP